MKRVFTNGCYDLLHCGHVRFLQQARKLGDHLVVGLNSDRSVKEIKGPTRPIIPQAQRAEMLRALRCVDEVVLFDEATPREIILKLRPDVLCKGGDWARSNIIGADEVESWGGKVVVIPTEQGYSSTGIIERIQRGPGPTYYRKKDKVVCSCGMLLYEGYRRGARHQNGIIHAHGARIKALLDHECLTFADIGARLGITREWVRQIAVALGYPAGHDRTKSCHIRTRGKAILTSGFIGELRRACPLPIELVRASSSASIFYKRFVHVSRVLCQISSLSLNPNGYYCISRVKSADGVQFVLGRMPDAAGWMVIPREYWRTTQFKLGDTGNYGTRKSFHGWNDFLNAWHLIAKCNVAHGGENERAKVLPGLPVQEGASVDG